MWKAKQASPARLAKDLSDWSTSAAASNKAALGRKQAGIF